VGTAPQLTISRYGLRKSIVVARRESDHTFQLSDACVKINFGYGLRKSIVVARGESDHTFQLSDACVKINFGWRRE